MQRLMRAALALTVLALGVVPTSCGQEGEKPAATSEGGGAIVTIADEAQLREEIAAAGDKLLMFDLYADWCMPCRMLTPVLEEIAAEHSDRVTIYKINIDEMRSVAREFGVSSIPLIVYFRDGKRVHSILGVHPKGDYLRAIDRFARTEQTRAEDTPDGELVAGKRIINLPAGTAPGRLYVYRGETISITFGEHPTPYSVSIPQYEIAQESRPGEVMEISFRAKEIGVFPIFCNGRCPAGGAEGFGHIIVMQFEAEGEARFTELDAREAAQLIRSANPLILDVRTPGEYYDGHIEHAKLIPLHQLEQRLGEIDDYKDRDLLVYCRSGNRSTVAAEILIRDGFKRLYHLRPGIRGWRQANLPVTV